MTVTGLLTRQMRRYLVNKSGFPNFGAGFLAYTNIFFGGFAIHNSG